MPVDTAALADPTDFGNRPGDGPLRAGGQPAPENLGTRKANDLPSTRSKASKRQRAATKLVTTLWGGQDEVHKAGNSLLPQNPGEDPIEYNRRKARSVFHNFFRRSVEGMVGLIFRVDPQLSEDVPAPIVEHWENIDMAGTHGDVFLRDIETDAMREGHACILVEFPNTDGEQDAASEMVGEIRPYWVPIRKDNILSWRTVQQEGRTSLQQIVLLEESVEPDGDFGEKERTRYRVFRKDPETSVVGFVVYRITDDKALIEEESGTYGNQDEIPITEVTTSGRKGVLESDPPLLDVAHLNVAHYQQWSDYALALHKTVPFLFTAGVQMTDPETGKRATEIEVGPNSLLSSQDPNATATYVGHQGSNIQDQKQAIEDLKSDIGSLGLAMLAPQKRAAETAEAKRLDKSTSDSALSVSARALQDAVERALQFHANYLAGQQDGGSVTINRDFEGLMMQADVMRAYADLVKVGFPKWMALEMLQQGGRLPEEADLEAIEMEWEVIDRLNRDMTPTIDALEDDETTTEQAA